MASDLSSLVDVSPEDIAKSILVSGITPGTTEEAVVIHFQQRKHGGGDVSSVKFSQNGDNAVITFEEKETVEKVLKGDHRIEEVLLKVDRFPDKSKPTINEIFTHVTATLDPVELGISPHEAKQILEKVTHDVDVSFQCDKKLFVLIGKLKEINECHLLVMKCLNEGQPIDAQLNNLSLANKGAEVDNGGGRKALATPGRSDVIVATRIYERPRTKVIPFNKVNSDDQAERVHPTIEARWFQVDPYAFRFMERFFKEKLDEIKGECLLKVTASSEGTRVILQAKQNCEPSRYNAACSKLSKLIETVTHGMATCELDLNGADEDSANVLMEYIATKYPVIIDRPQERSPFFVYGDAASVGEARRIVRGGMSQQESYDTGLAAQEMVMAVPEMISFENSSYRTENGVCISLRYGDITAEKVDAIVNPANEYLFHGAGLAKLIVQRGGPEIQRESNSLIRERGFQSLHIGDAVHTVAGNLRCNFVIHAVGPEWFKHSHTDNMKLLQRACLQSLKLASKLGLSSIAIPAISSGIFGAPIDLCAFAMFNAVEEYLRMPTVTKKKVTKKEGSKQSNQKHKETDKKKKWTKPPKETPSNTADGEKKGANSGAVLNDIRFVLIDADSMDVFEKIFNERFGGVTDNIVDDFEDLDDEHDDGVV
ncbi:uncharacterized protein LOC111344504 isoform X2 [Stylophora pistillata]|uniref:Macro domain-containing protein n=1 Tax=Stylophora pistillata TaxID=50429 RepID=A0A2B4RAG7_STYPI|nr:uncharacterized protein LOC111344504 isoform X2 [Stylophora pistillata]PFX14651.1 hypothetical protein AWC38_SpisGene21164 [Stylophora pistillata]